MSGSEHLFENAAPEAGDRFSALAELFDPVTIRHFEALGISEGWDCLELGAGGGSIAHWLSKRVGPSGHVLATDLDVRWFAQQAHDANLEIRRHDLVKDPLPDRAQTSTGSLHSWRMASSTRAPPCSCPRGPAAPSNNRPQPAHLGRRS